MESLNLNNLASSLPQTQQNAEKELLNNFKAAALSITTLYRSSRTNSKRAYNAGYATACQDLLNMIQQGVSAGGISGLGQDSAHDAESSGMTIGKVMDWLEARLEELKSREEEEEEEEEREKERNKPLAPATNESKPDEMKERSSSVPRNKDPSTTLPTPNSPIFQSNTHLASEPSSPSPPPSANPLKPLRPLKAKPGVKSDHGGLYNFPNSIQAATAFNYITDPFAPITPTSSYPEAMPIAIGAGAKRRHAVMRMLDSSASPISIGGSSTSHSSPGGPGGNISVYGVPGNHGSGASLSRRRTRSSRNLAHQQTQNQNINVIQGPSDAMDIEEDGRERKRPTRR